MELTKLGWNSDLNQQFAPHHAKGLVPARVAVEDKHFFRVWTADAELLAQVSGKCIHEAGRSNSKLPKVGDWVAVKLVPNEEKAVIQAILPRRTRLSRNMAGHGATEQILATNIDTAFMVTAADASFDTACLEQMLVVAHESGSRPVVVLNKIDLCGDLDAKLAAVLDKAPFIHHGARAELDRRMRRDRLRGLRLAVPLQVGGRRHHDPPHLPDMPRDQRGIGEMANSDREIDAVLDQIDDAIFQPQLAWPAVHQCSRPVRSPGGV